MTRATPSLARAVLCVAAAGLAACSVPRLFGHVDGVTWSNESAAIAGLRAYLGAQGTFRREDRYGIGKRVHANPRDGTGFPDLWRVGGPLADLDEGDLRLVAMRFARATSAASPKEGYWFVDIVGDGRTGPYDFTEDCGLCAVPAVHGETGIHTFIINAEGTVYMKDNGGKPVTVFPDVARDGCRAVGE